MGGEDAGGTGGKLSAAVRVWLAHPRWRLPCSVCEAVVWDAHGNSFPRGDAPTPCDSCPKVPGNVKAGGADWRACRAAADEFTTENRAAFAAYFAFDGSPHQPDDPVFRWHAGIVRRAFAEHREDATARVNDTLVNLGLILARRR